MSDTQFGRRTVRSAFVAAEIEHASNTEFMEAIVAACAIISFADGEVASAERRRFLAMTRSEPRLAIFSFEELAEEFAAHVATINIDPEMGYEIAYEKLAPFRNRRREATVIFETCRELIPADGVIHPAERRAFAKVCEALGLDPEDAPPVRATPPLGYNPRQLPIAV